MLAEGGAKLRELLRQRVAARLGRHSARLHHRRHERAGTQLDDLLVDALQESQNWKTLYARALFNAGRNHLDVAVVMFEPEQLDSRFVTLSLTDIRAHVDDEGD